MIRFNQVQPGLDPKEMEARYQATVDMAEHAEANGFGIASLEEHHVADNGWSPSPLITAGLIFGRCKRIPVSISALLVPLHEPIRLAEDIAVLELASGGGRLTIIAGLGYRPVEYAALGKSWADRGQLMEEALIVLRKAWSGEPFEHRGETIRVTPVPKSMPTLLVGGHSKAAARRAARLGFPMSLPAHNPELQAYYEEQCKEHGTTPLCLMPPPSMQMTFVADDPDKTWAELGQHFFNEASTYSSWQPEGQTSAVHSHATSVDELRAEGIYEVVTPDQCVELAKERGAIALHPLVGGMPIDAGWSSLNLYCDKVLPRLSA